MRIVCALLLLTLTACLDAALEPLRGTGGARLDFTSARPRMGGGAGKAAHAQLEGRRIVVRGKAATPTVCARLTGALSESGNELKLRLDAGGPRDRDTGCADAQGEADYRAVIWNLEPGEYRLRVLDGRNREQELLTTRIRVP